MNSPQHSPENEARLAHYVGSPDLEIRCEPSGYCLFAKDRLLTCVPTLDDMFAFLRVHGIDYPVYLYAGDPHLRSDDSAGSAL